MTSTTQAGAGVERGLSLRFHEGTSEAMGRACRDLLDACGVVGSGILEEGKTYYRQSATSERSRAFTVIKVTPSRAQIVVRDPLDGSESRLYQGSLRGATLRELSPVLVSLLGVTHEAIVREAARRGLGVAPAARREYPDLVVDVPGGLRLRDRDRRPGAPPDDGLAWLREALRTNLWAGMREPGDLTAATVDGWIEQAHRDLARIVDEGVRRRAAGADTDGDFIRYEREYLDRIERWRWLRPLLEPGGVFHVESMPEAEVARGQAIDDAGAALSRNEDSSSGCPSRLAAYACESRWMMPSKDGIR
jgi:hypothetical protein